MDYTKKIFSTIVVLFIVLFIQSISAQDENKKKKETVKFYVEELNCKNCQAKIEKNIAWEKGVSDLKCDLKTRTVEVTYKTNQTDTIKLAEGFKKIGMPAVVVKSK